MSPLAAPVPLYLPFLTTSAPPAPHFPCRLGFCEHVSAIQHLILHRYLRYVVQPGCLAACRMRCLSALLHGLDCYDLLKFVLFCIIRGQIYPRKMDTDGDGTENGNGSDGGDFLAPKLTMSEPMPAWGNTLFPAPLLA